MEPTLLMIILAIMIKMLTQMTIRETPLVHGLLLLPSFFW